MRVDKLWWCSQAPDSMGWSGFRWRFKLTDVVLCRFCLLLLCFALLLCVHHELKSRYFLPFILYVVTTKDFVYSKFLSGGLAAHVWLSSVM